TSFPLLDKNKKPLNLLTPLQRLKKFHPGECSVFFQASQKLYAARLCAVRKTETAAAKTKKRIIRNASKRQTKVLPKTLKIAEYVAVLTTLPKQEFSTTQILNLYRCRWQIELAFKRLKSLIQVGHV